VTVSAGLASAALALGVFAATNIDDVLVLTVLFVSSRSFGLLALDESWVRLLGLLPIALGLRGLWLALRHHADDAAPIAGSWWAVAGITIANGADNISVYAPLLRTMGPPRTGVTLVVFYLGVALWVGIAYMLGRHHRVAETLGRIQHWLGPLIFVGLGVAILLNLL
jgi:cadmium resistance protein CadD (predicted permease)